ncbi:hypothetical protein LCGC14_0335460 [marine sediment metagenome]|uniref:Polymerase/histidinol phosphatase N-terminal domain-containing protein n=1 Tax=marine sediment metagenome TaxID=412755 RepID=A0A0F9TY82_9ZZZZ|nr:hypothetical protein [Phycisphaerae bacterium]HDZ43752.1 hypothetical protein [Phycisphaerae bacterium]
MTRFVNPFEQPGQWYKANFHTHTNASDGALPPRQVVANYRRKGYDVLAITDHGATHDVRPLSTKSLLVISGTELHPPMTTYKSSFHLVALNVPHGFKPKTTSAKNQAVSCVRQVAKVGGLTILGHPFWCGMEFADYKDLKDVAAVEVWNTICDAGAGRGCSENEWAYILDRNRRLPAVAVDDTHSGGRPGATDTFGGWTWLKMRSLTVANVLKAVRTGATYASCGPKVHDFRVTDGKITLRCSPAARITFKSGPGQGERREAGDGKSVSSFKIKTPSSWPYVRAVVTDATGRSAWTNPIYLKS